MGEQTVLPLGVVKGDEVVRDASIREMTAGMRRKVVARKNQKNPAKGITEVLFGCVETLAGAPPTVHDLNALTEGDRDFLLLAIRRESLGDTVTTQMPCPNCNEEIQFELDLNQIRINSLEKGTDYELVNGTPVTSVENDDLGLLVKMRFPTGFDWIALSPKLRTDPMEANYEIYARILKLWQRGEDANAGPFTPDFVDSLSLKEITWFERACRKAQPGPDWFIRVTCDLCGRKTLLDLSDSDFLFTTPR